MKVFILYAKSLKPEGSAPTIGGIQIYIENLCNLPTQLRLEPIIYQFADIPFVSIQNEIKVVGDKIKNNNKFSNRCKSFFNECMQIFYSDNDVLIFATDSDKHIAVVPTTGSEGIFLSLLEAMACKCGVIGTNVGVLTNIVLDGYNGIMIKPDENKLNNALLTFKKNEKLRCKLRINACKTYQDAFSHEIRCKKWGKALLGSKEVNCDG